MADYCKQCSEEIFGKDFEELAGLSTPEDTAKGLFPIVICEGCGATQVNHLGVCIAVDCNENHGAPK